MARISSSTLFNFTDSIDHLVDNLKNGFYCHNTYENFHSKTMATECQWLAFVIFR